MRIPEYFLPIITGRGSYYPAVFFHVLSQNAKHYAVTVEQGQAEADICRRKYGQTKIPEASKIMASGTFLIRLCNGVGGIRTRVLNVFTDPSTCLSCFHTFRVILTGELYAEN